MATKKKRKCAPKKHAGVNQKTGKLKKGYKYKKGGGIVKAKCK